MATNIAQAATKIHQMFSSEGGKPLSESDDGAIEKQIQATHCQHGSETDVKSTILTAITDVLRRANISMNNVMSGTSDVLEETNPPPAELADILKDNAASIYKISCELSCQCSGGEDPHATTMAIFQNLPNYSWDAKVVISLAAFAVKYGEFCLITQLSTTNSPLAKSVSFIKQSPDITVHASALKSHIEKIKNLLKAIMNLTEFIFKLKESFLQPIPSEILATAKACFPLAAYWTIQSMVACSSHITIFLSMCFGRTTPTPEVLDVSSLVQKLTSIQNQLTSQLEIIHIYIEKEKRYQRLIQLIRMDHVDNMTILRALINLKDDKKPALLDWCSKPRRTNKTRVSIEQVLLKKTVVLLISDLDIVEEEFFTFKQSYLERKKRSDLEYEIVWIPVIDNKANQEKFELVQAMMPWYIVAEPWLLDPIVIRYMKEVWQFSKKEMLVVLDSQGKVVCNNALHMFRIWENGAYPFTAAREESLWIGESWTLDLLVNSIDQTIMQGISQGKDVICLYGGIDMEWIREFTAVAKVVAEKASITIRMVYVGHSNAKERVKRITSTITAEKNTFTAEKLIQCSLDPARIRYFWTRFESMWYSRTQYGKTVENDNILQEVSTMLSFGGSYLGWATIGKGSDMVTANGDTILEIFNNFDHWSKGAKPNGFLPALTTQIKIKIELHHCNKLTLPWASVGIPDELACKVCKRLMEKYLLYRCCTN